MSTGPNRLPCTPASSLAADQSRAEALLAELAIELRRVPLDESMRALHVRALGLKRAVMRWPDEEPDESTRLAILDEVLAMQDEARGWQRLSDSRMQSEDGGRTGGERTDG